MQRYRYLVLHRLPSLRFLDSRAVSEAERDEARRVGPFMRIVRPADSSTSGQAAEDRTAAAAAAATATTTATAASPAFSPLPDTLDADGAVRSRATFGVCKYVYYGRHSEGNRFIRNSDL